jgi:hypothetical protein
MNLILKGDEQLQEEEMKSQMARVFLMWTRLSLPRGSLNELSLKPELSALSCQHLPKGAVQTLRMESRQRPNSGADFNNMPSAPCGERFSSKSPTRSIIKECTSS